MISASVLGTSSAPAIPWTARAAISSALLGAIAHSSEQTPNADQADREHAPAAEQIAERAADEQQR